MAPEALLGKKYGHKRDVWALGAMYIQLITDSVNFSRFINLAIVINTMVLALDHHPMDP